MRCLSLAQSLLKGRNAPIWDIGHQEVKVKIYDFECLSTIRKRRKKLILRVDAKVNQQTLFYVTKSISTVQNGPTGRPGQIVQLPVFQAKAQILY